MKPPIKDTNIKSEATKKSNIVILKVFGSMIFIFFSFITICVIYDAEPSEEQPTQPEIITNQFSAWDGSHKKLSEHIKKSLLNPDSYKHIETSYWVIGAAGTDLVIQCTFECQGGFGSTVRRKIKVRVDDQGEVIKLIEGTL